MRTEIEWAELHAPLFLAGTNLGQKLNPKQRLGLTLEYDEEKRHLYVSWMGKVARIPETSVLSMNEATPGSQPEAKKAEPIKQAVNAQVESPTGHVFAGAGHGKTGVGSRVK